MSNKRQNKGKAKWSLIDFESLEPMVRVMEKNIGKYGKNSWKEGYPVTEVCESLLRHLFSFLNGEDNDSESGESHIGHIQANAMILSYVMKHLQEMDDR